MDRLRVDFRLRYRKTPVRVPFMSVPFLRALMATLFAWFALATAAFCGDPLTVTDQKGRSIEIELVSVANDTVTFTRKGNPKEFTMPVGQLDQKSQELVRTAAADLPTVTPKPAAPGLPKIQADVVIGKRRKKEDSYYKVKQEVTGTVKIANLSTTVTTPAMSGKLIYVAQNTRTPSIFCILSSQNFEATVKPGETFTKDMETFTTIYDSDNKGSGNVGGYQYFGYVLALLDDTGAVVLSQTTTGSFRMALADKPELLKQIMQYPKDTRITDKLETAVGPER